MPGDVIHLNVGGTRYSTSRQTLTWVPDSFFTSLLSGRISSLKDETGAIFIDRDPKLFSVILNYLRTKELELSGCEISSLLHEAEFYGIASLVRRLKICEDLHQSSCGDVLFHGYLKPPDEPLPEIAPKLNKNRSHSMASIQQSATSPNHHQRQSAPLPTHSRHISIGGQSPGLSTLDAEALQLEKNKFIPIQKWENADAAAEARAVSLLRVNMVKGHHNWIAVAYQHFVCCFRMKDSTGWHLFWTSPHMEHVVEKIALNAKVQNTNQNNDSTNKMVAASVDDSIRLWSITDEGNSREIGVFKLNVGVDSLFFIGSQLVGLSHTGKVGVWHAMSQHWQIQDVVAITSYDTAGSFLLLGCEDGCIYYIDMQKFPLRMKDNDLLVTKLYQDPDRDMVTSLSVYLTPKTSLSGNWIEIAYGTGSGTVRVIVQHPETVGQGPQLFQTFTVHRSPVTKVMLSEKHLVSVCAEYNHVRTWNVTRFRGMISTQPGSTPLASFKVISLDDHSHDLVDYISANANDIGPYGEQDDQQVFIQKVVPETDTLFVRLSSCGKRVCVIKSVDNSDVSAFCVHECEGSNRMGSRPRRFLFTGHSNGSLQMWDLTTAMDMMNKTSTQAEDKLNGPTPREMMKLLDQCDLASRFSTPCVSPCPSLMFVPPREENEVVTPIGESVWHMEEAENVEGAVASNSDPAPYIHINTQITKI